ncbi:MAG: DNA cytosine methyltransferase [Nitrosomonadales bacterium]
MNFFEQIEVVLLPLATQYTPEGSEPKAVVHQWIHAIANGATPFAAERGASTKKLTAALKMAQLYTDVESFKSQLPETPIKPAEKHTFTFIDLFAGIGGMRIGFQEAGGVCVFSSEFEKNAQATYCENHGDYPFGDITKIPVADIPDHDVLIAGFPCQPFSHAGLKKGIDDTRGTLFYNIANILKEKKPKIALLENVKGLISNDKGNTLQVVLKTLIEIGYSCNIDREIIINGTPKQLQAEAKKMVLRSVDFGVPQNRQRIYIVLWIGELAKQFIYPVATHENTRVGSILEENPDPKYTISTRLWKGHQRRKVNNVINGKGFGFSMVNEDSPYTSTISARYYKDGSEILIEQKGPNPRKLTPREAARLQGFPDCFKYNKSEVQAYKQFGNSVSVPVVIAIANEISSQFLKG